MDFSEKPRLHINKNAGGDYKQVGTHPAFVDAVRRVVEARRYVPATRQGRAVAQLVQLPYEFLPEVTGAQRRP